VCLMAGRMYREAVMLELDNWGIDVHVPHPKGLGIGQQLAWYAQELRG